MKPAMAKDRQPEQRNTWSLFPRSGQRIKTEQGLNVLERHGTIRLIKAEIFDIGIRSKAWCPTGTL